MDIGFLPHYTCECSSVLTSVLNSIYYLFIVLDFYGGPSPGRAQGG